MAPALTGERIVAATAATFGTSARRLLGRRRDRELVLPRQVAMYLARRILRGPLTALAGSFGRDHTTLLHASRTVAARLQTDAALAARVDDIARQLAEEEAG